ncbi:MAG TPA: hypothetical protein VIP57_15335 [Candidatus Dormibacteraeota bacterium]
MDDLRSEIRAAFEKEQAVHPVPGGLRSNLAAAVAIQSRPAPNLQWIAVAMAALLGTLVVAGLMSARVGSRLMPTPAGRPPSVGVPLLYLHDPNHPTWLIGYDWSGKPQGTVKLSLPDDATMTPDGSAFYQPGGKGGPIQVFDRTGRPIANPDATLPESEIWADDNQHLCRLDYSAQQSQWRFNTRLPGESGITVPVALDPKIIRSGILGLLIAACSIQNDQAILFQVPDGRPADVWVVRASTGEILARHTFGIYMVASIVASRDGAYVAVTPPAVSYLAPGALALRIMRVSDWSVAATLPSSRPVLGFSGDGSRVLVGSVSMNGPLQYDYAILDWRTNRTSWRYDGTMALHSYTAQPGGRAFAMAFGDSPIPRPPCIQSSTCPPFEPVRAIVIANPDGTTTAIPGGYFPAW